MPNEFLTKAGRVPKSGSAGSSPRASWKSYPHRYPRAIAMESIPTPRAYDLVILVSINRKDSGVRKFGWESGSPISEKPDAAESDIPRTNVPPPTSVRKGESPYLYLLSLSVKIFDGKSMKILTDKKTEGSGFFYAPANHSKAELNKPMADGIEAAVIQATDRFAALIK